MTDHDQLRQVTPGDWRDAVAQARADGYDHFDWLGCVDGIGRDAVVLVVLRLLRSERPAEAMRLTVSLPREAPQLDSIADLFAGAGWHEREGADLFGVGFVGGDGRRLLFDPGPGGPPLRKGELLAARAAQPWPGAKDRRTTPLGVPDPAVWGDRRLPDPAAAEEIATSTAGARTRRTRSAARPADPPRGGDR